MIHLTMCKGDECPIKEHCLRFTNEPGKKQDWFTHAPYKNGKCEFFNDNGSQNILQQLDQILKPKQ